MTREEVHDECIDHYVPAGAINSSADVMVKSNVEFLFDLVFNEINSRICENCEYAIKQNGYDACYECMILSTEESGSLFFDMPFGCNKFERKTDE